MRIKDLILWIWQLPQNVCGWLLREYYRSADKGEYFESEVNGADVMITPSMSGGVSLGKYIFLHLSTWKYLPNDYALSIAHESGHCVQSRRWGWLYLIVIGIPSLFHLLCRRAGIIWSRTSDYYSAFPERQADELGGVKRSENGKRYVS